MMILRGCYEAVMMLWGCLHLSSVPRHVTVPWGQQLWCLTGQRLRITHKNTVIICYSANERLCCPRPPDLLTSNLPRRSPAWRSHPWCSRRTLDIGGTLSLSLKYLKQALTCFTVRLKIVLTKTLPDNLDIDLGSNLDLKPVLGFT